MLLNSVWEIAGVSSFWLFSVIEEASSSEDYEVREVMGLEG